MNQIDKILPSKEEVDELLGEQKKENCVHCDFDVIHPENDDFCNIGNISNCKSCKKFYHYDWLKSDMESEL